MAVRDLTERVERLEAFEERCGIRLDAVSALLDDSLGWITVRGEVHPLSGTELTGDVNLVAVGYDRMGRVVADSAAYLSAETFYGFDTFALVLMGEGLDIALIRLYPKG